MLLQASFRTGVRPSTPAPQVEHRAHPLGQQKRGDPPGLWVSVGMPRLTGTAADAYFIRADDEANLSAAQHTTSPYARLSCAHVDAGRPAGPTESSSEGPQTPGADSLQEVVAHNFAGDRRLRRHAEFVVAQRVGRRVATAHFTLLVSAQRASTRRAVGPPRLGLVVARKVGGAIKRNRVKRLCRECFRLWPDLLPVGVDLVVIARAGAHELGLADVRREWEGVEPLLKRRAAEALARVADPDHPGTDGS